MRNIILSLLLLIVHSSAFASLSDAFRSLGIVDKAEQVATINILKEIQIFSGHYSSNLEEMICDKLTNHIDNFSERKCHNVLDDVADKFNQSRTSSGFNYNYFLAHSFDEDVIQTDDAIKTIVYTTQMLFNANFRSLLNEDEQLSLTVLLNELKALKFVQAYKPSIDDDKDILVYGTTFSGMTLRMNFLHETVEACSKTWILAGNRVLQCDAQRCPLESKAQIDEIKSFFDHQDTLSETNAALLAYHKNFPKTKRGLLVRNNTNKKNKDFSFYKVLFFDDKIELEEIGERIFLKKLKHAELIVLDDYVQVTSAEQSSRPTTQTTLDMLGSVTTQFNLTMPTYFVSGQPFIKRQTLQAQLHFSEKEILGFGYGLDFLFDKRYGINLSNLTGLDKEERSVVKKLLLSQALLEFAKVIFTHFKHSNL